MQIQKFKHVGESIENLVAQLPQLVGQYMRLAYQDERAKEDEVLREKWRVKDKADRREQELDTAWLQHHTTIRGDLIGYHQEKVEEHKMLYDKYVETTGRADALLDIDQTDDMVDLISISASNAMDEVKNDVTKLQDMIQGIDASIASITSRSAILNEVAYQMSLRTKGQSKFSDTDLEKDVGFNLWTEEDIASIVTDMEKDESFLTQIGIDSTTQSFDNNAPSWLVDYFAQLKTPSEAELGKLNTEIMAFETNKIALKAREVELAVNKKILAKQDDPLLVHTEQVLLYTKSLESINNTFQHIPGFSQVMATGALNVTNFNIDMASDLFKNVQLPGDDGDASILKVANIAFQDGNLNENQIEQFTMQNAVDYLNIKASVRLARENPLAMIVGSTFFRSAYAIKEGTATSVASIIETSLGALNRYAQAKIDGDVGTQKNMESQWAASLGWNGRGDVRTATYKDSSGSHKYIDLINQQLQGAEGLLTPIYGGVDFIDNNFVKVLNNKRSIEESLEILMQSTPANWVSNTNAVKNGIQVTQNSSKVVIQTNAIAACAGNGGTWNAGTETCIGSDTSKKLVSISNVKDDTKKVRKGPSFENVSTIPRGAELQAIISGDIKVGGVGPRGEME